MAGNSNLASAMEAKQDEFYTQLRTIEDELRHYRKHFKGKTVLCNCDDPFESNFFKYFALNFNKLGLKKLIATCYAGSSIAGTQLSLFGDDTDEERRTPYKAIVTTVHDATGNGGVDMLDVAELYVDDDKEIGHRAIANSGVFEKRLGLTAAPFDAKKASGLRFYKAGHPIKGHQDAWPGYIEEQLGWALEMKRIIAEIEL